MELILDNIIYHGNNPLEQLNNVSYSFKNGINFLSGIDGNVLKKLLFLEIKPVNGYIMVNEKASKKDVYLISLKEKFNKNSLIDEATYLNEYYHLNYDDIKDRLHKALLMVGLDIFINCYFNDLSSSEQKKVHLALALFINSKIIILDNMDKGLSSKDMEYIRKLLNKIAKSYNKNIIVCSDNLERYLGIVDNLIVINEGKIVVEMDKHELYNDLIYKYIKMPGIIHFIKYLGKRGHIFDNYIETKELLKAIYRDVENK